MHSRGSFLSRAGVRLDLTRYFRERGVEMVDVQPGLSTPLRFGDADAEHMATRRAAGLFDFSFMACVEIRGSDALRLLEAVQTRNLAQLPVGSIRYTLILRDDGTVLNDATAWRTADDVWLFFVGRRADAKILFERGDQLDVSVTDCSEDVAVLALQGPRARETLRAVLDVPAALSYYAFVQREFDRSRCLVARIGYSGEFGYEIVIDTTRAPALWQALRNAGATECGFNAVNMLRIEAGHILFTNELACRVTPRELRLERLVERDRSGPARPHAGAPERRLCGFLLDAPLAPSPAPDLDRVHGDHAVLTSACRSPLFKRWIGLGFVSDECRYAGTRVRLGPSTRATVARLPFYDPRKRLARS